MRLALISDVHGAAAALEAVIKEIKRLAVDQVVFLGDAATLGPCPGECLDLLRDLGCRCLQGNHDAALLEGADLSLAGDLDVIQQAAAWAADRLSAEDRTFLATFTSTADIPLDGGLTLLACHGSPASFLDNILPDTETGRIDEWLGNRRPAVLAVGHTHMRMLRQFGSTTLINPGSVGMPFVAFTNGGPPRLKPFAEFAVIETSSPEVNVTFQQLPLDLGAVRSAIQASGAPLADWLVEQYK